MATLAHNLAAARLDNGELSCVNTFFSRCAFKGLDNERPRQADQ